jgi:UDPglucose 6-dehydrogenase
MKRAEVELPPTAQMRYATSIDEAARDADALLILTDWKEFASIDLGRLHELMRYPIVIDGRNLYDPDEMMNNGFTYLSIGRPAATPSREPAGVAG